MKHGLPLGKAISGSSTPPHPRVRTRTAAAAATGRPRGAPPQAATELKELEQWDSESVPAAAGSETATCTVSSRPPALRSMRRARGAPLQRRAAAPPQPLRRTRWERAPRSPCPLVPRAQGWARARRERGRFTGWDSQASAPLRELGGGDGEEGAPLRRGTSTPLGGGDGEEAPLRRGTSTPLGGGDGEECAPPRAAPECESFRLCKAYVASLGLADGTLDAAGNRCYCRQPGSHPHAARRREPFIYYVRVFKKKSITTWHHNENAFFPSRLRRMTTAMMRFAGKRALLPLPTQAARA